MTYESNHETKPEPPDLLQDMEIRPVHQVFVSNTVSRGTSESFTTMQKAERKTARLSCLLPTSYPLGNAMRDMTLVRQEIPLFADH